MVSQADKEEGMAILMEMPPDANPFEYLHNMKKAFIRKTAEEALAKILFKESVAAVKFDLRHQKNPTAQNPTTLLPLSGHKFVSKSAPTSPTKSDNNNASASTINKVISNKREGNNSKQSSPKRLKGAASTSTLEKGPLEGAPLEGALIQLKAVLHYTKEFLTKNKNAVGRDKDDIARESFFLLRRLCKNTVDLLTCTKFELTSSNSQLIRKGVNLINNAYQKYSEGEPQFQQLFSTNQTGIAFLVDSVINYLADPNASDAYTISKRGNFAHEVFDELKSLPIRHYIFDRLCEALKVLLFRSFVPALERRGKTSIIDYGDINRSFRYLQLIEFIIFTTGSIHGAPWLEEWEVKGLKRIDKKYSKTRMPFANVLTFLARIVFMAEKFKKQEESNITT